MKFLNQYDKYSCAPIAIMNALRWLGFNHNNLEWFRGLCNTKETGDAIGTHINDIDKAIKTLGLQSAHKINPSINYIDRALNKNHAVIITYYGKSVRGPEFGHVILCTGRMGPHYKVINCDRTEPKPIQFITREKMIRLINYIIVIDKEKAKSQVWVI